MQIPSQRKQPRPSTATVTFLVLLGLAACSRTYLDGSSLTPPGETSEAASAENYYQFSLEEEFGSGIVEAVDWAPDGSSFALATSLQVDIYDAQTLDWVDTLETEQWNEKIAYSPDGQLLAIGGSNGLIQIWDLSSNTRVHSLFSTGPQTYYGSGLSFSFSRDGQTLVSAYYQTVYLWNVASGQMLASFPGHTDGLYGVVLSPDGETILAYGSASMFLRDVSSGELLYTVSEQTERITAVTFSKEGHEFFTVHSPYASLSKIGRWDASSGERLDIKAIGKEYISSTDVDDKQETLVLGGEGAVRIWDLETQKELSLLSGQTGRLDAVAISPDGKQLITVGSEFGDGRIELWDIQTQRVLKTFEQYVLPPTEVAISPSGKYLAMTGRNQNIRVVDVDSGSLLYMLDGGSPIAFSPNSTVLAYRDPKDLLVMADAKTGEALPVRKILCSEMSAVAFSPDGETFAVGGDSCDLQIYNARSGQLIKNLSRVPGNEYLYFDDLVFSTDGSQLFLAGYNMEMLDAQTGEKRLQEESDAGSHQAAFSPDGRYLAISGMNGYTGTDLIEVREVRSNRAAFNIQTRQQNLRQMAFSPDGRTLLILGETLELWDLWTGEPLVEATLTDNQLIGTAPRPDGTSLILLDASGSIQLWSFRPDPQVASSAGSTPTPVPPITHTPDIPVVELTQVAELGKGYVSDVFYSPDGSMAALIQDQTLRWFEARSHRELGSMEVGEVWGGVLISPDNKTVIVDSYGAQIIDLESRQVIGTLHGGNGNAFGFTFSRDSRYIAYTIGDRSTGGPYHHIGLWDRTLHGTPFTGYDSFPTLLEGRYHSMSPPAISPDTKLVAAGHSDKRMYVWDLQTGETRFILEGHAGRVTGVAFSPNGGVLASCSDDGTIRLWDPSTGKLLRVITGFMDDIARIHYASNGQALQVRLADGRLYLLDLSSSLIAMQPEEDNLDPLELQQVKQGYSTSSSSIFSEVLYSPDGHTLAMGSRNVLLWDITSQELQMFLNNPTGELLRGMAFNRDGSQLAATTGDQRVLVWDTRSGEIVFSRESTFLDGMSVYAAYGDSDWGPARSRSVLAGQGLAYAPSGNLLAFGNRYTIEIWNTDSSEMVALLENPQGNYATQLSFSADGKRLYAILNRNRTAQIWDLGSEKLIRQAALTDVDVNAFSAVALQGQHFARNNNSGDGENGWIEVWDLERGSSVQLPADSSSNEPLLFSPDGALLLSLSESGAMVVWNTTTGARVYQTRFDFSPGGISLSPSGGQLAVGNKGKASLFDFSLILQLAGEPAAALSTPQTTSTPIILEWPTPTPIPAFIGPADTVPGSPVIGPDNVSRVQERRRWGKGTVEQVLWSPDGTSMVVTGSLGVFEYRVDLEDGELIAGQKHTLDRWAGSSAILPDGRLLSAGIDAGGVYVVDIATGKTLLDLEGGGESALSPDGRKLVFLNPDGVLELWDIPGTRPVVRLGSYSYYSFRPVFSPDGNRVAAVQATGRYKDAIRVWDTNTGEIVNALGGPDYDITALSFTADGKYLAGAAGGSAWVWEMRPGALPERLDLYPVEISDNLNLYTHTVTAAALSPDHRTLAVGTSEHSLKLYDRASQKLLQTLNGHAGSIHRLYFSPDGGSLISVDRTGAILLWDVSSGKNMARLDEYAGAIGGVLFRLDGNISAWSEGTAWEIDPATGDTLHTTYVSSGRILAASPAGNLLAGYEPHQVSLWDAQSGERLQTLEGEAQEPYLEYYWEGAALRQFYAAAFSRDGSRLITAGSGGAWYYDTLMRRLLLQIPGSNAQKVALSLDGQKMLASLYEQANPVSLYDLTSGSLLFSLHENGRGWDFAQSVFSPDGRWVGAVYQIWDEPYRLAIYDTLSMRELKSLDLGEDIPLNSVAFNPTNTLVAVGRADGRILLIDLTEMKVMEEFSGHRGAVLNLVFSPDGGSLVSAGADGTIRIWGLP